MTIGIVVSEADEASAHVGEHLRELGEWERDGDALRDGDLELRTFEDLHIHLDGVAEAFDDPDYVVFASRHSGETGALLTAHFTGNFGEAEYGGADRDLAETCPNAAKHVLDAMEDYAPEEYEVGMECTHHGPTDVGAPAMFVELGSGEEQWADPDAAEAVARGILDLDGVDPTTERTVVAFGGGHYAPRPTRIVRETAWAVGHVGADWCLDDLGKPSAHHEVVAQAFENSGAERAVVDGDHPDLEVTIDDLGYEVRSETWVREVGRTDLDLVDALESDLERVEDGLRFGESAPDHDTDEYVVREVPGDLWDAAQAVDPEDALDAVAAHALAYETVESGNRVQGRAAFAGVDDYDAMVDRLAELLDEEYESVEREADRVVAQVETFDPAKAHTLGVPEGPKFGRLAAGEPVTVDNREIPPETVRTTETKEFPV
ncbi:D-aminoacyl-tRNA deacylase [Halospeciosus flavus]|uniref:D-aminoacyl-tRNA deacylase n=1 Tax=Halospeciosus flavus TaxID=3032283 RepID=A0ABD5Z504_9EURY|nr:D-aminoacyl-tRNA deacylase [Halospeciosus flavus]